MSRSRTARPALFLKSRVMLSLFRLMLRKYALSAANERGPPATGVVAFAGLFDFDDASAHIAQKHCAVGTRQHSAEIENGDSIKWSSHEKHVTLLFFSRQGRPRAWSILATRD